MKFYISTYFDHQIPIISKDAFERDGSIAGDTLMINQTAYTLTKFRKKFDAITRRKAICNFLYPNDWDCAGWQDYTAKQWETMLAERLMENINF